MKAIPPGTTSPAELEADEAIEHDDFEEPSATNLPLAEPQRRRVLRLAEGIGKLTVDGVSELAHELASSRSPGAALLHACLQQELMQAQPRRPRT